VNEATTDACIGIWFFVTVIGGFALILQAPMGNYWPSWYKAMLGAWLVWIAPVILRVYAFMVAM
jgi:hypothetical protein